MSVLCVAGIARDRTRAGNLVSAESPFACMTLRFGVRAGGGRREAPCPAGEPVLGVAGIARDQTRADKLVSAESHLACMTLGFTVHPIAATNLRNDPQRNPNEDPSSSSKS